MTFGFNARYGCLVSFEILSSILWNAFEFKFIWTYLTSSLYLFCLLSWTFLGEAHVGRDKIEGQSYQQSLPLHTIKRQKKGIVHTTWDGVTRSFVYWPLSITMTFCISWYVMRSYTSNINNTDDTYSNIDIIRDHISTETYFGKISHMTSVFFYFYY